jgi:hypothetical protein
MEEMDFDMQHEGLERSMISSRITLLNQSKYLRSGYLEPGDSPVLTMPKCAFCSSVISRVCEATTIPGALSVMHISGFIALLTLIGGSKAQCPDCTLLHNVVKLTHSSKYAKESAVLVELSIGETASGISQMKLELSLWQLLPDECCSDCDYDGLLSGENHVYDCDLHDPTLLSYGQPIANQMDD